MNYAKIQIFFTQRLHKAIYELEQLVFLFDWTQENDDWDL